MNVRTELPGLPLQDNKLELKLNLNFNQMT